MTDPHEGGFEAGYAQACEDFGATSAAIAAQALREAAAALGHVHQSDSAGATACVRFLHERANALAEKTDIADAEQRGALRALRALDQDMRAERQRDPSTYNVWSRVRGVIDGALAAVPTQAPE